MECYCEPMEADESCPVWQVSWRKAKKEHKCCECGDTIKPGERYEYIFCIFEGEVDNYKTCEFCAGEFARLQGKFSRDFNMCKTDLACVLVWDMRNEIEHGVVERTAKP